MRAAHVCDAEEQLVLGVALADDRQTTEHDGVRALLGTRQLGEDESGHERLYEDSDTRLEDESEERHEALRLNDSVPIVNTHTSAHGSVCLLLPVNKRRPTQGKGFPYSTPSVGPGADPGVQAVSLQVTVSHPPGGRLPLFWSGLQLPPQPQSITALWPVPSYTAWWQRHIGVNNLPKVVTRNNGCRPARIQMPFTIGGGRSFQVRGQQWGSARMGL